MAELNNSSTGKWSETDASNTSPSPDGWPSGTFPNQVEPIGRSTMGAIKRFWDRLNGATPVSGTANAIILTPSNTSYPTAYVQGEIYQFTATAANTGATTININGLGTKNIYKKGTSGVAPLSGGEIQSGDNVLISYDGAQFQILSAPPLAVSGLAPITSPNFATSASLNSHPLLTQIKKTYVTSTSVYTPTTGMVFVDIEALGGGGAGAGAIGGSSTGGGGGAGERRIATFTAAQIGASQTVTIGSGGTGVSASNGGSGTATSVGALITANPGVGGTTPGSGLNSGLGGNGGTGGQGFPGQAGGFGLTGPAFTISGSGGNSIYGAGGQGVALNSTASLAGLPGLGYASGGGGGSQDSSSSQPGGNGAPGIVVLTEYISA